MTVEKWIKSVVAKQPVYDSKDEAVKAAIQANKKPPNVYEVWQQPNGGKYVVAAPEALEALYRAKYKRILDPAALADIERGDHIDEIEEV